MPVFALNIAITCITMAKIQTYKNLYTMLIFVYVDIIPLMLLGGQGLIMFLQGGKIPIVSSGDFVPQYKNEHYK